MPDNRDVEDPILDALADARERVTAIENQLEYERTRNASPEDREAAERQIEGKMIMAAVKAAQRRGR